MRENYLGLGIADAAIRRVSQTGRLIVRPTSAVRRYLNEDTDALTAAKQLGVDSVLEGSLQRAGDRLRVSVNLLRCLDGKSLWSDSFDILMADIFTVQDTVAQQVASRLRLQLDASQQAQLTKRYTSNPVAYEFYLKGAYNFDQRMRDPAQMMDSTISYYKKAIEADPNFALAHAQLAYAYAIWRCSWNPHSRRGSRARRRRSIARRNSIRSWRTLTWRVFSFCTVSSRVTREKPPLVRRCWRTSSIRTSVTASWLTCTTISDSKTSPRVRLARALEIDPTSEGQQRRDAPHVRSAVEIRRLRRRSKRSP